MSNLLMKAHLWALNKRAEMAEAREAGEAGQGVVEYSVVIGVIVVGVVIAWNQLPIDQFLTDVLCGLEGVSDDISIDMCA